MSTKKESEKTTTKVSDDTTRVETTSSYSPTPALSEQRHSVDRALDETRDNIRRTIEEAKKEIPRHTQAFNDYQEHVSKQLGKFQIGTWSSKGGYKVTSVNMGSICREYI